MLSLAQDYTSPWLGQWHGGLWTLRPYLADRGAANLGVLGEDYVSPLEDLGRQQRIKGSRS